MASQQNKTRPSSQEYDYITSDEEGNEFEFPSVYESDWISTAEEAEVELLEEEELEKTTRNLLEKGSSGNATYVLDQESDEQVCCYSGDNQKNNLKQEEREQEQGSDDNSNNSNATILQNSSSGSKTDVDDTATSSSSSEDNFMKTARGENLKDSQKNESEDSEPLLRISIVSLSNLEDKKNSVVDVEEDDPRLLNKSPKEILYDIATGKWSSKHLVPDLEKDGMKTLSTRPCSNAQCVREAERQKRRMQQFAFKVSTEFIQADDEADPLLFDDGELPSYHSLTGLWMQRQCQWAKNIFKTGYPQNDVDFIEVWRECRRNPEAFGIKISPRSEFPDQKTTRPEKPMKIRESEYKKLRYHDSNTKAAKEAANEKQYNKMRKRFDELRKLYPHFDNLPEKEYGKISMQKLKIKLKQAEDWHNLLTNSASTFDLNRNEGTARREDSRITKDTLILPEIPYNVPRYAMNTKSFSRKMRSSLTINKNSNPL